MYANRKTSPDATSPQPRSVRSKKSLNLLPRASDKKLNGQKRASDVSWWQILWLSDWVPTALKKTFVSVGPTSILSTLSNVPWTLIVDEEVCRTSRLADATFLPLAETPSLGSSRLKSIFTSSRNKLTLTTSSSSFS